MIELNEQKMRTIVSSFQIPVKPEILTNIQNLMAEEFPDINDISAEISKDVGLSSAILKIINSPSLWNESSHFGNKTSINDVRLKNH